MKYNVPLIPQTHINSCWAASIAMILGWKKQMSTSDDIIARNAGGRNYMTSSITGLDPNDKYILRANGFKALAPQCYTSGGINALLSSSGPLWVATWAPGPHIRVVTGLQGNTVFINDPSPVNMGSRYTQSFNQFFGSMESLGARESSEPSPVYIAHLF